MNWVKFEKTEFGSITISGMTYNHDVYLHVDGKIEKRDKSHSERIKGHRSLCIWELKNIIDQGPEVLLIGMGQSGILPMSAETEQWLETIKKEKDIEIVKDKTPNILEKTNQLLNSNKKIAGIFHTTC